MRYFVLAILLGFPLAEVAVLVWVGQASPVWMGAWLILAAVLGVVLIKEARFSLLARLAAALSQGRFSVSAVIDSGRTVLAGLLLIFPGLLSDFLALALLLLPVRDRELDLRCATASQRHRAGAPMPAGVIEGEFHREV